MAHMTDATVLGVATFNVCGLPWSQSSLAPLAERVAEFGRHFEESGLDVVNMQEVWSRQQLTVIGAHLPSYPYVAWRRGLGGQPAGGLATFSRRPIGAVRYRSFRGTLPNTGSPRFRAKRVLNGLLQGVLTTELAGLGAVIANTHLTANKDGDWSAENRYHAFQGKQVALLHAVLRRARTAGTELMLVTGDFNIASGSPLYPRIVADGWRDPFRQADRVTFHAEFLPPGCAANRIDYALVSGDEDRFPVLDSGHLFAEPLTLPDGRPMHASDHVALTVRVGLARGR